MSAPGERLAVGPMDRRRVWDWLLVLALWAVSASITASLVDSPGRTALAVALASAHVLPLLVRRERPVEVVAWMSVTGLVFVVVGFPVVGLGPAALVAVYAVAAHRPRPTSLRALALASLAMALATTISGGRADTVVGNVAVFGAVWFLGDVTRRAWDRAAELSRTREELAHRAVVEERLRIARELHDIVAHALSVIAVQSGTGRMVAAESPHLAAEALAAVEETSRTALQEMRRLLDLLRVDDADVLRSPSPGLDRLDELAAVTAANGLAVDVNVEGERRPLPPGVDAAAYRILQEALTNVRKHAAAQRVGVTVRYGVGGVELEVADDGRGPGREPPGPGGHGLIGMRERVALYGGVVEAGRGPSGGFLVRARIPDGTRAGSTP